jgi:catalase-peroxidase
MGYFEMLFGYEWELTKSPAGAHQWRPKDGAGDAVPDAHDPAKRHAPMMTTADLALRIDPIYEPIARRFHANPAAFADAFARAWFKLTHRDMGPRARYLGSEVPAEALIWQDPVPAVDHPLVDAADVAALKASILASGLSVSQLVSTAWASASTFRGSTSAAAPTGRACASRRRGTGPSTSPRSSRRCWRRWRACATHSTPRRPTASGLAGRPHRAGRRAAIEQAAKQPATT